jgi:hypothetical protein
MFAIDGVWSSVPSGLMHRLAKQRWWLAGGALVLVSLLVMGGAAWFVRQSGEPLLVSTIESRTVER